MSIPNFKIPYNFVLFNAIVLQLLAEVSECRTFHGWQEGAIEFSPTYKYYPNSNEYYGCLQGRKGEKRRAPAW